MTYFGAFPHSKLYLHARIAEYVFRLPATAVFLNTKVVIKNFAMRWRSYAHIWSTAYFTILLMGTINGGGLRYANIRCSGINPFSLHWVKPCKKVVTAGGIPEQRLLFVPSFVLSKLDLLTAHQQKQVETFRSWNKWQQRWDQNKALMCALSFIPRKYSLFRLLTADIAQQSYLSITGRLLI